ncbi:hypothetical protein [Saccharothrix deserti]|nr:hypothetical protein [Saccharothrix deserti]
MKRTRGFEGAQEARLGLQKLRQAEDVRRPWSTTRRRVSIRILGT